MNRNAMGLRAGILAVLVVAGMAPHASAFALRLPQINVMTGSLQNYFNSLGESVNVNTDQINAQVWSTSISGNSVFTLMIEYAGYANSNAIGVYNTNELVPTLFQVFPGNALPGWHALISFQSTGNLVVTRFDENSTIINQTVHLNVHANAFGFYLQGPGGLFYSQDYRNANSEARMVTYAGTGLNFGEWWLCFEDLPVGNSDQDFEDAVVILESVVPVGTKQSTLGAIKALYR